MKVVVAVDFSEVTRRILEVVLVISDGRSMRLYLIHVAAPGPRVHRLADGHGRCPPAGCHGSAP